MRQTRTLLGVIPSLTFTVSIAYCLGITAGGFIDIRIGGASPAFAQPAPIAPGKRSDGEIPSTSSISDSSVDEDQLAKDDSTEINVKNADIAQIIRIFSRKLRRNFILDERVKGKVSIYLPGKVSTEDTSRILDSVLAYKGFASVPIGQNIWKIVPAKDARTSTIPTRYEGELGSQSASVVTRLVQLKYVNADEVRQLMSQLVSADGFMSAYAGTNSLIIIDGEDNISRLMSLIETLDVPFTNREMSIIPITHAEATDIAEKLNEILGLSSSSGTSSPAQSPMDFGLELARARVRQIANQAQSGGGTAGGAAGGATGLVPGGAGAAQQEAGGTVGNRSLQPKIISDERTNSIIVVADEDTTARVRALISQLDSKVDLSGSQYWVYHCQHANAEDLAEVLSGLVGGSGGTTRTGGSTGPSDDLISGGLGSGSTSPRSTSRSRTQSRMDRQNRTPGQSRNVNRAGTGVSSVELSEDLSITADPATNSLIIFGSKSDFAKVKALLEKLDVKRRQVLVEAMLLEVGIDDQRSMDVSWLASTGGADGGVVAGKDVGDIASLLSNPATVQDFALAAASAGTLTIGGGDKAITLPTQALLINAVRTNSNVNILSSPTILTTDNEEAEIVVGQNVPFVTSTASSDENLSNTFNQVERQDVGITLRLTPQISSGDSVSLKIFTEVSDVASTDPNLGPTTIIRTSETSVITKDNQMVVIGGLMADLVNESERGVPYLKDIPVLGNLFKATVEKRRRTNLLILITPRIIRDQYDHRDQTLAFRDKMEDEVEMTDSFPERSEVLQNPDMDHVAETNTYEGPLPTTMTSPQISVPREESPGDSPSGEGDEVTELRVVPKFSDEGGAPVPSSSLGVESSRAALGAMKDRSADPQGAGAFIVLQRIGKGAETAELPFTFTEPGGLLGIAAPSGSGDSPKSFFKMGKTRSYESGEERVAVVAIGVFGSQEEAERLYPELAGPGDRGWHTLSPYEIMSLGDSPWR